VRPLQGTDVIARTERPYFNRTWKTFCSHQYAPSNGEFVYPSALRNGRVIYFAHPLFRMYNHEACRWVKRLVRNAIQLLVPKTLVSHNGPSTLIATLNVQPDHKRHILHLQHYIPERRGDLFDTVEDVIPLHDLSIDVRLNQKIRSARLVPQDVAIPMKQADDGVHLTIPKMSGHQMIELAHG
jgi:hypothetical protein